MVFLVFPANLALGTADLPVAAASTGKFTTIFVFLAFLASRKANGEPVVVVLRILAFLAYGEAWQTAHGECVSVLVCSVC